MCLQALTQLEDYIKNMGQQPSHIADHIDKYWLLL